MAVRSIAAFLSVTLLSIPFQAQAVVGAIGGSHSVGNDGSASYSIPIDVPPGIAGMQAINKRG